MGAALFFSLGLMVLFSIPLVTAVFAKRMGRRPWLWFCIGIVLPGIASFIIFLLPDLSEKTGQHKPDKHLL
jgi:MFS family permease